MRPIMGVSLNSQARRFEDFGEALQVLRDDLRGLADQQRLRGIDDIVGGEAVVEPAGIGADDFGDRGGEGDDVVADLGFDFVDALDAGSRRARGWPGGVFGDQAGFGEGFGGGDFDGEPGAEAVFVAPDAAHLGAGIAGDHGAFSCPAGTEDSKWRRGIRLVLRRRAKARCTTGAQGSRNETPSLMQ